MDDSTYNLFVMKMILEEVKDMELEVVTALNGQIAVDTVTAHIPFDIVFLDLQMPVMDGYDAAKRMRELAVEGAINLRATKIVALSATTISSRNTSRHITNFLARLIMSEPLRCP